MIRYLHTTRTNSLCYYPKIDTGNELVLYTDSTWNSNRDNSRSRSRGYAAMFNSFLISWKSKLQSIVMLSSSEAEYVALNDAAKEGIWRKTR